MSEVAKWLEALSSGEKTLEEVVTMFEKRKWTKGPARPKSYEELVKAEESDPEPQVEGSFDEVSTAYALGQIDNKQYAALAQAAANSAGPKQSK